MQCNYSKIFTRASVYINLLCPNRLFKKNILQQIYGLEQEFSVNSLNHHQRVLWSSKHIQNNYSREYYYLLVSKISLTFISLFQRNASFVVLAQILFFIFIKMVIYKSVCKFPLQSPTNLQYLLKIETKLFYQMSIIWILTMLQNLKLWVLTLKNMQTSI